MLAPRKIALAVAGLFLATIVWLYWSDGKVANSASDQLPTRKEGGPETANSTDAAAGAKSAVVDHVLQSPAPQAPVQTTSNTMDTDDFVAATLKNPDRPILPSRIPALSDAQVDQLAVAYLKPGKPSEKAALLWALGFSQNDRAFDTLQYAMTSEYSGAVLSTADNVAQLQVAPLIGVLSRTSDRAWQFLVNLARPDAWGRIDVWSEDYLTEQYKSEARSLAQVRSTLQGGVIEALSASGRPEFMAWANSLYEGGADPAAFDQRHAASVSCGVFKAAFIGEHGLDEFYDEVMYDTRQGGSAYSRWIRSSEGQRWTKWWEGQVTQVVQRDSPQIKK